MMKSAKYDIDHVTATIILTKKFAKAAGILNTPEYKGLMEIRRQNPTYAIELRRIKQPEEKQSYLHLNYKNMAAFITLIEKDEETRKERLTQLETVKGLSKAQPGPYAYVKTWFLETYGKEYNKYRKTEKAAA